MHKKRSQKQGDSMYRPPAATGQEPSGSEIVKSGSSELGSVLEIERKQAEQHLENAFAKNTKRANASDWATFVVWCNARGLTPKPATPQTVADYASALAGGTVPVLENGEVVNGKTIKRKMATIRRHLSTISVAHKNEEMVPPTQNRIVKVRLEGIARTIGVRKNKKKAAILDIVMRMVEALPDSEVKLRDATALLVGYAGAYRRSELVSLNIEDVQFVEEGVLVLLRRSKTDQTGKGRTIQMEKSAKGSIGPVECLRSLIKRLADAGFKDGAIFRSVSNQSFDERVDGQYLARLIKTQAKAIGEDPALYSGHSLRSGFVTTAHRRGASMYHIARKTGHLSQDVLKGYIEDEGDWANDAGKGMF